MHEKTCVQVQATGIQLLVLKYIHVCIHVYSTPAPVPKDIKCPLCLLTELVFLTSAELQYKA